MKDRLKPESEIMAEDLRLEIEAWQNPVFETILGPLPQNIVDSEIEAIELEEAQQEAKLREIALTLPKEITLEENNYDSRLSQPDVPHVD
jgi:hypothetical protein